MIKVLDLYVVNGEKVRKEGWGDMLYRPLWNVVSATVWDEHFRGDDGKKIIVWRVSLAGRMVKIRYEKKEDAVKAISKKDTRKFAEIFKRICRNSDVIWLQGRQPLTNTPMNVHGYPWDVSITRWPEGELRGKFGIKWGEWLSWKRKKPIVFDSVDEAKEWFEENWEWVLDINVKKWHKERGVEM